MAHCHVQGLERRNDSIVSGEVAEDYGRKRSESNRCLGGGLSTVSRLRTQKGEKASLPPTGNIDSVV